MVTDAGHTIRNAGLLMAQRGFHILGAGLFAVMVPRMMGPDLFGRYALLLSVSLWFALLSGLGAVSVLSRSVPRLLASNQIDGLRRLATSLIVLRAGTGSLAAVGYFLVATLVLGEPDLMAAAFVACGVFGRTVGNLSYALFLGLNQAARWGFGDLMRRWLTLALVPVGFTVAGLRGACLGFLGAELFVLTCGLWWARPYLRWADLDLGKQHLGPYLRTSMLFAVSGLVFSLTQRSGETLVRFSTGSYAEVAFFGAAFAIYLTIAHAFWQFALAFAPFLVTLLDGGQRDAVTGWLERLLKYMVVVAVVASASMVLVGPDLVPLLLGAKYRAVATNAVPLTMSLLPLAVGLIGRLVGLMLDRPGMTTVGAALELTAFWACGILFARHAGSLGACWAVLPASVLLASYLTWRTRRELPVPLGAAGRAVALSLVFVPLAFLRSSLPVNVLLFAGSTVAYAALLLRYRVVTVAEIAEVRGHLLERQPAVLPAD